MSEPTRHRNIGRWWAKLSQLLHSSFPALRQNRESISARTILAVIFLALGQFYAAEHGALGQGHNKAEQNGAKTETRSQPDLITKDDVLSLKDGRFFLQGKPFAEISFNKYDLFWHLYDQLAAGNPLDASNAFVQAQEKALRNLHDFGFRTIRVFALPWGPEGPASYRTPEKRKNLYAGLDKMLELCEAHDIRVVWSLGAGSFTDTRLEPGKGWVYGEEQERELVSNPESRSRKLLYRYLDETVSRYKDRQAVLMWEISNEVTLQADIGDSNRVYNGERMPSLKDVAGFFNDVAKRIKLADPLRLVSSGGSNMRESQWHLFLGQGWKRDSFEEQFKCLELLYANSAIDVVDIHSYPNNKPGYFITGSDGQEMWLNNKGYMAMAKRLDKPLMIGELGLQAMARTDKKVWSETPGYFESYDDTAAAKPWVLKTLNEVVEAGVPLSYWWCYQSDSADQQTNPQRFDIDRDRNPELISCVVEANRRLKARVIPSPKEASIPELNWEPRSDWINVRTASPVAKGDGITDDTEALQVALDRLSANPGEPNTLYLPPGKYRITRTLTLKQKDGITIIGHGRMTRILWDGAGGKSDDARMIWSNGAPRSRYIGLTWDGRGKAFVGFDHDSKGFFETEIDHQHEAFFNFTGSGIRVGHDQVQATAETTYVNCLFSNCESGLTLMQFNDYNHTLAGCEFLDCGFGINACAGPNFYVRDSHFERSRVVDIRARGEHSLSVRRCTSNGSHLFLEEATIAPLTIQDCQVSAWTNASGAVQLGSGPVLMFDCAFTKAPNMHPPVVVSTDQHLVLSNNRCPGTEGLVRPGDSRNITEIPPGQIGPSLVSPERSFVRSTVRIPGKLFDARRDFGAKGDRKADDTAAIQAAIDAARKHGAGAMAYLPSGDYVVTKTLEVTGKNYYLGGSGTHSRLLWRGDKGGVLVRINDPEHLVLENLDIGSAGDQVNSADILQTGSGIPASIRYERIWVFGMYRKQPGVKGFQPRNLSAGTIILADHLNGNLTVTNCAGATLLFNSSYEGAVTVAGRNPAREGLLGFMTRLATINTNGLYVNDSQSVIMSDYYVESADRMMEFRGNPEDSMGRVTIQMAKSHCSQNPTVQLENYCGQITLGPCMFYPGGVQPALMTRRGSNRCDFILMACQAYEVSPKFDFEGAGQLILLENTGAGMGQNQLTKGDWERVASALDDLRKLGALDLRLNHDEGN